MGSKKQSQQPQALVNLECFHCTDGLCCEIKSMQADIAELIGQCVGPDCPDKGPDPAIIKITVPESLRVSQVG